MYKYICHIRDDSEVFCLCFPATALNMIHSRMVGFEGVLSRALCPILPLPSCETGNAKGHVPPALNCFKATEEQWILIAYEYSLYSCETQL
jgi:hypothetical protein